MGSFANLFRWLCSLRPHARVGGFIGGLNNNSVIGASWNSCMYNWSYTRSNCVLLRCFVLIKFIGQELYIIYVICYFFFLTLIFS